MRLEIDARDADEGRLNLMMIAESEHDRRTLRTVERVLVLAARIDGGRTVDWTQLLPAPADEPTDP